MPHRLFNISVVLFPNYLSMDKLLINLKVLNSIGIRSFSFSTANRTFFEERVLLRRDFVLSFVLFQGTIMVWIGLNAQEVKA